jgi:anti-anti-sigma regulatory factor/pSer/pThr/pTyr-binding forkhead associated (FHA) protein
MKVYLIVAKGKHQGMPIPVTGDLFLMGTSKECQLRSNLPGLAAQHCAMVIRDNKIFIRDLASGQATVVNGEVITHGEEWPLHKGDRIEVGPFEFMLQFQEKNLNQRDLEEWALRSLDQNFDRAHDKEEIEEEQLTKYNSKMVKASMAAQAILDKLNERRGTVKGRLRIGKEGLITVVRINDFILVEEGEVALIKKELYDNLNKTNLRVLLDFKNVKRMSTAAVVMIDEVYSWLTPRGSNLAMCRIRPEVEGIMKELTLRNQIPVFREKQEALTAMW